VRRLRVALVAITAWAALGPAAASAQQVDPAVDDLRDNDVTFEEGALSSSELGELDAVAAQLQSHDGYFKVVVLAQPIEDFDSGRDFAERVRVVLGGQGRVLVWTPNEVALSSNLDTAEETDNAERAAADRINSGGSLASATSAAAEALGADAGGVTADPGGGGGFPWLLALLVVGTPLVLLWVMWRSARKQRERAEALSQKLLEEADTRPELEAAYCQVVNASWEMDTTRALLAGEPAPPEPEPEPLFPGPVVAAAPVGTSAGGLPGGMEAPRAEPQYRQPNMSQWIIAAAMARDGHAVATGHGAASDPSPDGRRCLRAVGRRAAALAVEPAIVGRHVWWRRGRGSRGHAERARSWPGNGSALVGPLVATKEGDEPC
jgi:hypothetical protein